MWTWLNGMAARICALFRTGGDDRDFRLELESHLSMLTEDKIRAGMTASEARRQARIELGGIAQLEQAHRETRRLPFVDTLLQDLRYTFRTLRHDKVFAIFAILIIGVGIGASTTVLSMVNALLLRPLPFDAADRLVWVANTGDKVTDEYSIQSGHFPGLVRTNSNFCGSCRLLYVLARWRAGTDQPRRVGTLKHHPYIAELSPLSGCVSHLRQTVQQGRMSIGMGPKPCY